MSGAAQTFRCDACRACVLWARAGAPANGRVMHDVAGAVERRLWLDGELSHSALWHGAGATVTVAELDGDDDVPAGSGCELCGRRAVGRVAVTYAPAT